MVHGLFGSYLVNSKFEFGPTSGVFGKKFSIKTLMKKLPNIPFKNVALYLDCFLRRQYTKIKKRMSGSLANS